MVINAGSIIQEAAAVIITVKGSLILIIMKAEKPEEMFSNPIIASNRTNSNGLHHTCQLVPSLRPSCSNSHHKRLFQLCLEKLQIGKLAKCGCYHVLVLASQDLPFQVWSTCPPMSYGVKLITH
ncbi:uncharacterized protein LOC106881731 [Octopus bimaculoides]|uniref:uncharacterized protein LOC106881731 n=1 Tax=Octopus bimaculoides TaxID=37653 RepID=UPI0022E6A6D7|nr:uncharacterized protein LOC106881731 [Octopus bimaculoides]